MPAIRKHLPSLLASAIVLLIAGVGAVGCSHSSAESQEGSGSVDADVLYRLGDTTLTVSQVVAQIPEGLTPADSAALFESIADEWLYSMLLERDVALSYSERQQIEAQVRQYRRRLLAARYRESVSAAADESAIPEDSVRAAYEAHRDRYVLSAPLVKGIMLRLPANTPRLEEIRRRMHHPSMVDVDRIEKEVLPVALQYEYFMDEWHDWRDIASLVPYRFPDADAFVATHPALETESGGSIYLLTVTDHIPSGKVMPYETAAPVIRASMLRRHRGETDRALLRSLRDKAVASGNLKVYTPNIEQ